MTVDLRAERVNRGLTLKEAARQMGLVGWKTLMRAEGGEVVPSPPNAFKIASFYGYRVTDVWPLPDREPEPEAAA